MKKNHGYFDSIYKDKKQQEFAVYGFFTTIPGKLSALLPGTDLIVFDFRITEIGDQYLSRCQGIAPDTSGILMESGRLEM